MTRKIPISVHKPMLMEALENLASYEGQKRRWMPPNLTDFAFTFTEDVIQFYDDSLVGNALENDGIIFDKKVTEALREVSEAIDKVDDFRDPRVILDDPLMQVVREKAAIALDLIHKSDGKEGTVILVSTPEEIEALYKPYQ